MPNHTLARLPLILAALAAAALPPAAVAQPAPAQALSAETREKLTCSALFAIIASEQARGQRDALALPALGVRGREYFVRAGAEAMDEGGLSREQVRAAMQAEVSRLQQMAVTSDDPQGLVAAQLAPCMTRLDAEVAPLTQPTLAQCAAIFTIAYDELFAAEGLTDAARDMKILSSVLDARARKTLTEQGVSGNESDRQMDATLRTMHAETQAAGSAGVERYDLGACYVFAQPEKSHY